jgi:hypothetical protein
MSRISTFLLSTVLLLASTPFSVMAQDGPKSYGEKITAEGAMSIEAFAKAMSVADSLEAKVECEIITSCTVKGCWMDVKMPDGGTMKVRFKDYGFFVPKKGLEGKHAVLQGNATRETLDVATLRHYAQDAGKSKEEIEKITEPRHVLSFLADGVLITD